MFKKAFAGIFLIAVILFASHFFYQQKTPQNYSLKVNDKDISLLVADTDALRVQGLSGRDSLSKDTGMLFVFDTPDTYGFWMKDMKFPLDIIWLDGHGKIVYIEEDLTPESYPSTFIPPQKSLYVLETNTGFVEENHLAVGNILNIIKK